MFLSQSMRVLYVCYVSYMGYHCVCDLYGVPLCLSHTVCVLCLLYGLPRVNGVKCVCVCVLVYEISVCAWNQCV